MYIVKRYFVDTLDNYTLNEIGEYYPRAGLEVDEARVKELIDKGFIEEIQEDKKETKKKTTKRAKSSK